MIFKRTLSFPKYLCGSKLRLTKERNEAEASPTVALSLVDIFLCQWIDDTLTSQTSVLRIWSLAVNLSIFRPDLGELRKHRPVAPPVSRRQGYDIKDITCGYLDTFTAALSPEYKYLPPRTTQYCRFMSFNFTFHVNLSCSERLHLHFFDAPNSVIL